MNIWEIKILEIITSNAGTASLKHIYCKLPQYINLTSKHNEIIYNAPRYHHQTRAHIDDLMDSGYLIRISRGVYSSTSKGQLRISS